MFKLINRPVLYFVFILRGYVEAEFLPWLGIVCVVIKCCVLCASVGPYFQEKGDTIFIINSGQRSDFGNSYFLYT